MGRPTLAMVGMANSFLHFMATLLAHQKFATLSSKTPRAKGNRRCRTWRMSSIEDSHGRNMMAKVVIVTTPSLTRCLTLYEVSIYSLQTVVYRTHPFASPK